MTDWVDGHRGHDNPASALSMRLERVTWHLARALDAAPPGPVQLVSLCAGQVPGAPGRDSAPGRDRAGTRPRRSRSVGRRWHRWDRRALSGERDTPALTSVPASWIPRKPLITWPSAQPVSAGGGDPVSPGAEGLALRGWLDHNI